MANTIRLQVQVDEQLRRVGGLDEAILDVQEQLAYLAARFDRHASEAEADDRRVDHLHALTIQGVLEKAIEAIAPHARLRRKGPLQAEAETDLVDPPTVALTQPTPDVCRRSDCEVCP